MPIILGTELYNTLTMTNKELKRARYIFAKKEADILLTKSEQIYWEEHEKEYLASEYHQKYDILSDEDAKVLRERFGIPVEVDVKEFFAEVKKRNLRKKFPGKVLVKEEKEDGK